MALLSARVGRSAIFFFGDRTTGGDLVMRTFKTSFRTRTVASLGMVVAIGFWSIASASGAQAATVLTGPIDLGTASTYGVLAASAVTNTGPTVVTGNVGVSPQSSITGFEG